VNRLSFASGCFDLVVAAFVLNHLHDPVTGLRELRRVTRPGGVVAGSVFSRDRSAAKRSVDTVAADYGYVAPAWYSELNRYADRLGSVDALRAACDRAGFSSVTVSAASVDVGLTDPALVVRYRLGMPQLRGFVDGLSAADRIALTADAVAAVRLCGERFAPEVVEVVARA
jgi:SAM-dependent methyltransferase